MQIDVSPISRAKHNKKIEEFEIKLMKSGDKMIAEEYANVR